MAEQIYEAARLRGLAYFNDYDVRWVSGTNRKIKYYIDPGVALLMFIWPGRLQGPKESHNKSYLATFVGDDIDVRVQVADAVLSGECLFRPDLLDANALGPREMLPRHWEEFVARLRVFLEEEIYDQSKLTEEFSEKANLALTHADLSDPQFLSDDLSVAIDAAPISERARALCAAVAAVEDTQIMELAMLRRMRTDSLVLPATGLPQNIYRLDPDLINQWSKELRKAGKTAAIRADATVLAQLDALNAKEQSKPHGEERILHCLVTGDMHLHHAFYESRYQKMKADGRFGEYDSQDTWIPDWELYEESGFMGHYYLRHPAQFVPTLNQREMSNRLETRALFDHVVDATDALLASVTDYEADALHMAVEAVRDGGAAKKRIRKHLAHAVQLDRTQIDSSLENVRSSWDASMDYTVMINRSTLTKRVEAAHTIKAVIEQPGDGFQKMLEQMQLDLWDNVEEIGLYNASREAIGNMRNALMSLPADKRKKRRISAHLLCDLSPVIGETSVKEVQAALEGSSDRLFDEIDKRILALDAKDTWLSLMLCAILAARVSDWPRLIWIGSLVIKALQDRPDTPEEYFEALYAVSLGHRMRASRADYLAANALLGEAITHHSRPEAAAHPNEALRLARCLSERSTLQLFEQYRRHLAKGAEEMLPAQVMTQARAGFERALELIEGFQAVDTDPRSAARALRVKKHVNRQATLNLPFFDILGHFIYRPLVDFPDHYTAEGFIAEVQRAQASWPKLDENFDKNRRAGLADEAADLALGDDEDTDELPPTFEFDMRVLFFFRDVHVKDDCSAQEREDRKARLLELRDAMTGSPATPSDKSLSAAIINWLTEAQTDAQNTQETNTT